MMQVSGGRCVVTMWVWWSMEVGVVVDAGDHSGNDRRTGDDVVAVLGCCQLVASNGAVKKKKILRIRVNMQRLAVVAVVANGWWLSTWAALMMVDIAVDEDGGVRVVAAATGNPGVPTRAHLYLPCSVTVDRSTTRANAA